MTGSEVGRNRVKEMNYKLDIIRESVCCFADRSRIHPRLSAFVDSHCLDYLLVLHFASL